MVPAGTLELDFVDDEAGRFGERRLLRRFRLGGTQDIRVRRLPFAQLPGALFLAA
jgi:hypothetical protein